MSQLSIDFNPAHAARASDPESSKRAARKAAAFVSEQQADTLRAVVAHPGQTSKALAERSGRDRYALARRLPELMKSGLVRRTVMPGGARWYATTKGEVWVEENQED